MRVREAQAHEAAEVAALINRAFRVEDFFIDGDRTDAAEIAGMMAGGTFLVGGDFEGVVFVKVAGDRGYFGLLSIEPALQRKGLGRALVREAEAFCRRAGCTAMDMKIVDLRAELPAFYAAQGYVVTGTSAFPDAAKAKLPCHFVHMSKPL